MSWKTEHEEAPSARRKPTPTDTVEDSESAPQSPSAAIAASAGSVVADAGVIGDGTLAAIWTLSWPVMLSQVLATVISLVDIAMVGRISADALAAVGYATQLFFMTQSALFAVGFACVALMARSIGAGDSTGARRALGASTVVGVATAAVIAAAILTAPRRLLGLLNAHANVIELTIPYLQLLLGSSILLAVTLVLENGLRANRDSLTPMRIALIVAIVKTVLSAVLIFGLLGLPRLELVGAGLATVGAQIVGLVLFIAVVARQPEQSPVALRPADLRGSMHLLGAVSRLAAPGVAERIVLNLALLGYFAILATYGTVAVAAYTVGVRTLSFSWIPGTGFAAAVATLVGQALGAGDEEAAERVGRRAAWLALGVAVVLGLVAGLAREPIARAFTNDAATIAMLGPFMLCLAIAQPMLQVHFTLAGVHRGAGDTWTPLAAATVGNWCFRVPLAMLFAYTLRVGIVWLWAALIVDHIARAAWLVLSFRRGRWKTHMTRRASMPA